MAVFTDFKDELSDVDLIEETLLLESKDNKSEKDHYLNKYKGLVFTLENLSCKSYL